MREDFLLASGRIRIALSQSQFSAFFAGKVYDLLTLKCAAKSGAERVYALNLPEFTRLAPSELREKVGTVS